MFCLFLIKIYLEFFQLEMFRVSAAKSQKYPCCVWQIKGCFANKTIQFILVEIISRLTSHLYHFDNRIYSTIGNDHLILSKLLLSLFKTSKKIIPEFDFFKLEILLFSALVFNFYTNSKTIHFHQTFFSLLCSFLNWIRKTLEKQIKHNFHNFISNFPYVVVYYVSSSRYIVWHFNQYIYARCTHTHTYTCTRRIKKITKKICRTKIIPRELKYSI